MAVASSDPDLYYSSLVICPADGDIVTDLKHAFQSPHDGHVYHSQTCAEVQLMFEDAEMEIPDEFNQD